MGRYSKAFVALGGFAAVVSTVLADGLLASDEVETVFFAALTAVFVFLKRNTPEPPQF